MWEIINRTPYAADRCFARDERGAEVWIVAVKGTFAIGRSGRVEVASEQPPVTRAPVFAGAPGRSSLRYDSDLVLDKPGTDLLVHGHVHAPRGAPARRVEVGLRCGPIAKRLIAYGDRTYKMGIVEPKLTDPEPFTLLPLRYERAFGGADPLAPGAAGDDTNPVGVGFAVRPEHLLGRPAPNFELPGAPNSAQKRRPPPAGLGPIARDWMPRRALAGTYDEGWQRERMPLWPADFDRRFFQAAPLDQQAPAYLREGATVELLNLSSEGLLRFELPRTRPVFCTHFGRRKVEHRPRLHTVIVEPDERRVMLVWQTALPCQGIEHHLDKTVIREKAYA